MSSIQKFPVEILLDVFQANDPADAEALQLTCHRFYSSILPKVDTLPTRVVCDLAYGDTLRLYRVTANKKRKTRTRNAFVEETCKRIASGDPSPKGLQNVYQTFGRKTAIRKVEVCVASRRPEHSSDAYLMQLIQHFPTVKGAMSLKIRFVSVLPTDALLDHFRRLETIVMETRINDADPSFWPVLFATKGFRRVPNFIMTHNVWGDKYPEVDDGAMFDFITDFSLMTADKPRVIQCFPVADSSLDAVERRFYKIRACVIISDYDYTPRYITNMASGAQKATLAKKLLRDAFGA